MEGGRGELVGRDGVFAIVTRFCCPCTALIQTALPAEIPNCYKNPDDMELFSDNNVGFEHWLKIPAMLNTQFISGHGFPSHRKHTSRNH